MNQRPAIQDQDNFIQMISREKGLGNKAHMAKVHKMMVQEGHPTVDTIQQMVQTSLDQTVDLVQVSMDLMMGQPMVRRAAWRMDPGQHTVHTALKIKSTLTVVVD